MKTRAVPTAAAEVIEIIKNAISDDAPLEIICNGTKKSYGLTIDLEHTLDMTKFKGIINYEPNELFIQCRPGTNLTDLCDVLDANNQQLAFEPPDWGPMLGSPSQIGSVGGMVACNLAGPRRIQQGAARDHLLGFHAISGRGESFKSGGQVVKNVTGFDLSKLIAGSLGTLAVITELTLKVLPKPEKIRTIIIDWPKGVMSDNDAVQVMKQALNSSCEVSGAAHLPQSIASRSKVGKIAEKRSCITAIRIEGPRTSVESRCKSLRSLFGKFGTTSELHTKNSNHLWREIRDVTLFPCDEDTSIWRLSVPPASSAGVVKKIYKTMSGEIFYDWGGGQIWLTLNNCDYAISCQIFKIASAVGGEATLVRKKFKYKLENDTFMRQSSSIVQLARQVKKAFDPMGVLNPGRMHEGF